MRGRKALTSALCVLLLIVCARAAGEEPYPILRVTETGSRTDAYRTETWSRTLEYDERGLVIFAEVSGRGRTDGYLFYYQFDMRGNPKTVTVADAAESSARRTVTHRIANVYDGDALVSSEGPDIWGVIAWPELAGHFAGFRNASISGGGIVREYRDGLCVRERVGIGGNDADYREELREYSGGRLSRTVAVTVLGGIETAREETDYRPDGLPARIVRAGRDGTVRTVYVYADGTDGDGFPCLLGRIDPGASEGVAEDEIAAVTVRARMNGEGRLRTVRFLRDGRVYLREDYDSRGSLVFRDAALGPGAGMNGSDVFETMDISYLYR
ncbi:MAG: hypothetical protein IJK28_01115 [Clostridia bacterium]|nr:hypothetical protein [Clostridia bacterium]